MLAQLDPWLIGFEVARWVITVLVTLVVGVIGWVGRQMVAANNAAHKAASDDIRELTAAIAAEREARHGCSERHAAQLSEVREERPKRDETMGEFHAIMQRVADVSGQVRELAVRLDERKQP